MDHLKTQPWYHGKITRDEAEKLLRDFGFVEGSYLLRDSTSSEFAISVAHNHGVIHYLVQCHADGKYGIETGPRFSTPIHLIEHHKYHTDGLLTLLTIPVNRTTLRPKSTYGLSSAVEEIIKKAARELGLQDDIALEEQLRETICKTLHKKEPWYHGHVSREDAERRLRENGAQNGLFLVRDSQPPGSFAIGLCHRGNIYHYLLQINAQKKIAIDKGPRFGSIFEAIDHYKKQADGLLCLLVVPCPQRSQTLPRNPPISPVAATIQVQDEISRPRSVTGPFQTLHPFPAPPVGLPGPRPPPPPRDRPLSQNYQITSERQTTYQGPAHDDRPTPKSQGIQPPGALKPLPPLPNRPPIMPVPGPSGDEDAHVTSEFHKIYDTLSMKKCIGFANCFKGIKEVKFSSLVLDDQVIGTGNFGSVLKGIYKMPGGEEIPVAVKSLKTNDISAHQKSELIKEARIMTMMDHVNIVRMYGLCQNTSGATLLVMELAAEGPLHKYLKKNRSLTITDILIQMLQVSEGMAYLSANNFIHRDLAARNVLVVNKNFVKISDFGLSTAMGAGEDYYKAQKYGKWPLKWYAPECILFRKFSPKTDVWSYGVTLYEAVTYGGKPYEGMNGQVIITKLEEGYRLECPPSCPKPVYDIMFSCWEWKPENRPTFVQIGQKLAKFITASKAQR